MADSLPLLYLDTSIPSAYYNDRQQERQLFTQRIWHQQLSSYHLIVSNITLKEIDATKDRKRRKKLRSLVHRLDMRVLTIECMALANEYLKILTMPKTDAFHIAIATVCGCEALLSWNFVHLANPLTRQEIKSVNLPHGYRTIAIISPYEL